MPLMNAIESKEVGWDEKLITTYPTRTAFDLAISNPNRLVLIRWYRFLREPHNKGEKKMLEQIAARLEETRKDPATEGLKGLLK
jgi:hypothetical protein